jgi:BirA family biotin operon repressor/biotin-[acetyl-CoA-carboxylase] ligase
LLSEARSGWRIETFELLASTQDLLRERLAQGEDVHGLVIRALEQSAGRGQRARDWFSGRGGSWQTAALRDEGGRLAGSPVTLAIAVGLTSVFAEAGVQLRVKWPNDLLHDGKKVAGILCEHVQGHLLAGVGVNVTNAVPAGAAVLPAGQDLPLERVGQLVLAGISAGIAAALAPAGALVAAYAQVDALAGRQVEVRQGERSLRGLACGIDREGSLQLQVGDSRLAIRSGRVRLLHPAG